jgi:hypothetical protein
MLKIRSRVVNFRVTADEFERLKVASVQHGASCLSDFARSALLDAATVAPINSENPDKIRSLETRLSDLETCLFRLQQKLHPNFDQETS